MSANLHGLEFPNGLFYAPDYNLWLREEVDGSLTLGLSAYGCALYGEIFAFTPKRDGWHIERDRSFGVVEFAKAASSARSPLAGTLLASNPAVVKRPALINRDCYGEGWMVRLQPDDWASARGAFLQGDAAREAFAERMRLDGFDPQHPGVQALDF
ncbi:glycine cleavage system protein H [Pseudomonas aeruginosa]|uniref:glycine cleavage system protein H n=1 Tax=Pseudomonas aeruginosa TaxID=287 RepID=UPI000BA06E85|nr:glycine cleavage system protein H [Pseudomonas aeruginosa]OZO26690.1 glycine cleavage system protein H [Pseudomonas aeruginosa]RPW46329.1 glycine cleavage system protein H [Pseudomonas aeruginosa]RUG59564.1 glycine cleavage system protein H [Pseudomonas aeruginosa]UTN38466.1 glycine cleavage system protein H [Pseudomonas aeruginosa]